MDQRLPSAARKVAVHPATKGSRVVRTPRPLVALLGAVAILGAIAGVPDEVDGRRARLGLEVPTARQPEPSRPSGPGAARPVADASDRVIAPPPPMFAGQPAPSIPLPTALGEHAKGPVMPAGGVWAVVIGIDDYPGTGSDLRSAVADAGDVDAALARYGVPTERRLVLTNGQARAATIETALDWLVAHASADATAVLFYAGHVRKLDDAEAIVGADGDVVLDGEVASRLARLQAHRAWIAIAACYGGGFTEALAPGRILTAAADADGLAYENATYGRSYLVEYMVRRAMLGGAADDSIEQAFAWAADSLRRDHPDRVPFQIDRTDGELVLGVPLAPRPAEPLPAEPATAPPESTEPDGKEPEPAEDSCVIRLGSLVTCSDD